MRELTPIVAIDGGGPLQEGKEYTVQKNDDGTVAIRIHDKHLEIYMAPPNDNGIVYPGSDKPQFWLNGHKVLPQNFTIMSHMRGQFPGVTIRFLTSGLPLKMLQLIPRIKDDRAEKMKRQWSDYEQGLRTGFDLDYFYEYGLLQKDEKNKATTE